MDEWNEGCVFIIQVFVWYMNMYRSIDWIHSFHSLEKEWHTY